MGYIDKRERYDFVDYDFIMDAYYNGSVGSFITGMVNSLRDEETKRLKECIQGQVFLGGLDFIKKSMKYIVSKNSREVSQLRIIKKKVSTDTVLNVLNSFLKKTPKEIAHSRGINVWLSMDLLYRWSGLNQREIGELYSRDYSSVSISRKRLREKIKSNIELKKLYDKIESKLKCQE